MPERFVSKFSLIQGTEIPVVREGVPTFLGVPLARTPADLRGADAAIIGIPYDRPATAGRLGLDGLSFVYVAPQSAAIASIVAYTVVYLMAGWVLGDRLRRRDASGPGTPGRPA